VQFSGHNFPHVLEPLMAKHEVMINLERPLVIYESMSLDLERADVHDVRVEQTGAEMVVDGKRGNVRLLFRFMEGEREVGVGEKRMVLSGLRPYDPEGMRAIVERYDQRKRDRVE
jgi:hypothetical protein